MLLGWVSSLDVIASGRDPRSSVLERLAGKVSLTLYDRAGTGLSPGPVADYGMEASVEELAEVVRAVGPPVSLLAMSAAGPVAVALAARRPGWAPPPPPPPHPPPLPPHLPDHLDQVERAVVDHLHRHT